MTKVELIKIVTIDFLRALVIFERINDRGMGLNALDLLKNLLFKMSGSEEHAVLAKSWHGVIETLRKGGEKNHMRFLRYFLAANFDLDSDKVIKADDVFEWFVKNKEKLGLGRKTKSFVSRLQVAADDYVHMLQGLGPDGREVEALSGIVAQKGAVRQHLPILMAARKFPAAEFARLAEHLETLCLVFALSNAQWNELEKVGPAWCRKLREIDGDEAKLTQFLRDDFRVLVDDKLATAFEQLDRTDEIRPSLLKYMLARIAQRVDRDCGKKLALQAYLDNNVTVEHVLPQSLAINAVHEGFGDVESARRHVHRLGNLTLLDRGPNASVSDDAFEKKKRAYERSNYELTKALVTDLEFGKRTRYGATSDQYGFKPFAKWNPEAVESRQKQLRAVMKRIWNI